MLILGEVLLDVEKALSLALVAGAGLRDGRAGIRERGEDTADAATSKRPALLLHPRTQGWGAFAVDARARLPELLVGVPPVEAWDGEREELLLESPDVVAPVGDEDGAVGSVAALDGFAMEPGEERAMALEGRNDALVDRALERPVGHAPQREEHADERDLAVLALLALGAERPRVRASSIATIMAATARSLRAL